MCEILIEYGDAGDGDHCEAAPGSLQALLQRIQAIGDQYSRRLQMPYSVDLVREGTGRLSVGIGDRHWMLFFHPPDEKPALNSLGNPQQAGFVDFYFGDVTPLSRKYLIPREAAIEVIREWYECGTLSAAIQWTEEIFWD